LAAGRGLAGAAEFVLDQEHDEKSRSRHPVGPARQVLLHSGGDTFVTRTAGGQITWIDTSNGEVIRTIQKPSFQFIEFNADGSELLLEAHSSNITDAILRIDYKTGKTKKVYSAKRASKKGGMLTQLGSLMRTGGPDFLSMHGMASPVATRLSKDGSDFNSLIAAADFQKSEDGDNEYDVKSSFRYVRMELETGKWTKNILLDLEKYEFDFDYVMSAAILPDGSQVAVGEGNRIFVVDTETGDDVADFKMMGAKRLRQISFSPAGDFLAATCNVGVWVWELSSGKEVQHFEIKGPNHIAFSADGSRMAICGSDKSADVQVLEVGSWKSVLARDHTESNRTSIALSDEGTKLLIGLTDCRVEMWDLHLIDK
jgi:WD40 repeat protein